MEEEKRQLLLNYVQVIEKLVPILESSKRIIETAMLSIHSPDQMKKIRASYDETLPLVQQLMEAMKEDLEKSIRGQVSLASCTQSRRKRPRRQDQ